MSQIIYSDAFVRIADALETQNKMYKRVNDQNETRYEQMRRDNAVHDDLIRQIVSLNERLAHMANTIDDQNRVIMEQSATIQDYKGLLALHTRDLADATQRVMDEKTTSDKNAAEGKENP